MADQQTSDAPTEFDAFDAFAAKNALNGVGVVKDPYPRLAELRSQCPVHQGSVSARFDLPGADRIIAAEDEQASVYTYQGVDAVLRDAASFSSSWYRMSIGDVIGRTILEMDPPEHRRFRSLISPAFTRREMDRWEHGFVRGIVDAYLDRFRADGRADLAADFAFHYPIHVIAVAAGLPVVDLPEFYRHTALLTNVAVSQDERLAASRDLGAMVQELIDARRAEPADDLIGVLVRARLNDEDWDGASDRQLTDDEIVAFLRLLVPAGAQTTYRAITTVLYGLLSHPDQLAAVRADRSLIPQAIEEGLRWEVPLLAVGRTAVRDTVVEGCPVRAGQHVNAPVAAANHDPSRWERPDEFDIFRTPVPHVSFGVGPHVCLGIHAARMEMRVALDLLLDRLPGLRLDPDTPCDGVTGLGLRTAVRLPVVFDTP
ncbi:cytochrome P450 [Yinghuangia seranimata]|uniref:cytochrome P450 n=1 Tax=Yinghuangia seranimata TaxID=408067 RepID=UPI00248BED9C|nr:cytochrome P450 [Yinghuangia seranimata]MDI2128040.1 cytochrome P450 [Yinghuangia seranimata]